MLVRVGVLRVMILQDIALFAVIQVNIFWMINQGVIYFVIFRILCSIFIYLQLIHLNVYVYSYVLLNQQNFHLMKLIVLLPALLMNLKKLLVLKLIVKFVLKLLVLNAHLWAYVLNALVVMLWPVIISIVNFHALHHQHGWILQELNVFRIVLEALNLLTLQTIV